MTAVSPADDDDHEGCAGRLRIKKFWIEGVDTGKYHRDREIN